MLPGIGWGPGTPALAGTSGHGSAQATSPTSSDQHHGRAEVLTWEAMTLAGGMTLGPLVATYTDGQSTVPEAWPGEDHVYAASTRVETTEGQVRATARIQEARVTLPTGETLVVEGLDTASQATCQAVQASTSVGQIRLDDRVLLDAFSPGPDTRVSLPGGIVLVLNGTERLGETGIQTTGARLSATVPTAWAATTLTETLAVVEPEACS